MPYLVAPSAPLTDGVATLPLPALEAGDLDTVTSYLEDEAQLEGTWLPLLPLASAGESVRDWLEGWAGRPSHNGPMFVITIPDEPRFVGVVGVGEPEDGSVEMIIGVAPRWRRQGLATRALRMTARWLLCLPGVSAAELRVDQGMVESQRVAVSAGFRLAGTVTQFVPGTGETFEDLRYVFPCG
ncbi:MAG: GNAT family N-acetyltransferase [Candidatus Dormiibacterota bacterium]